MTTITTDRASAVGLSRTLEIPGFRKGQTAQCSALWSPDGRWLAGVGGRNPAQVWEASSGRLVVSLGDPDNQLVAGCFSPNGSILAVGGFDGTIGLYAIPEGTLLQRLESGAAPIWALAFAPNGGYLYTASLGEGLTAWRMSDYTQAWAWLGVPALLSLAVSPDGRLLVVGGRWGALSLLSADNAEELGSPADLSVPIGDLAWSPEGNRLAAASDDNVARVWQVPAGSLVADLPTAAQAASVWGRPLQFSGHGGFVNGLAWSPDGTLLATGSHDASLGLWDAKNAQRLASLEGHQSAVLRPRFSPDGRYLASIGWDGTVRVWSVLDR